MSVSSIFNLIALLVTLAAAFGYVNHRWLRLPHTIGLLIIALNVSLVILAVDALFPQLGLETSVRRTLIDIDFEDSLMKGVLSFLLFAGALHVDLDSLLSRRWVIGTLATVGIVTSTLIVAALMFFGFRICGFEIPLAYCLVFGALISPTDPVAVMGILKEVKVPETLEAKIAGESLFNDGVGVVLFTVLVSVAVGGSEHGEVNLWGAAELLAVEAIGGIILGLVTGFSAYRAMRTVDQHSLEVLITVSLVMATYALATRLHISGPLAVVVAGLFIGNHGKRFAMSPTTRAHIETFWSMLDEFLNSAVPSDRVRGDRSDDYRSDCRCRTDRHTGCLTGEICERSRSDYFARVSTGVHKGGDSGADLGWIARWHLRRARPVVAAKSGETVLTRDDLFRSDFLDRRSGVDR